MKANQEQTDGVALPEKAFNEEYPRFINTAQIYPNDGLYWAVWDRLNNVKISRDWFHAEVNAYSTHLNLTWGAQESPSFKTWEVR